MLEHCLGGGEFFYVGSRLQRFGSEGLELATTASAWYEGG